LPGGALLCRPQHSPPLGCIFKSSIQTKIGAHYVKTTSIYPSVTQNQRLQFCLISMKFVTGLFKKRCLASLSLMECSKSHILLQGIYKILFLFSTFPNGSGKEKQVGKGGEFRGTRHCQVHALLRGANEFILVMSALITRFW